MSMRVFSGSVAESLRLQRGVLIDPSRKAAILQASLRSVEKNRVVAVVLTVLASANADIVQSQIALMGDLQGGGGENLIALLPDGSRILIIERGIGLTILKQDVHLGKSQTAHFTAGIADD